MLQLSSADTRMVDRKTYPLTAPVGARFWVHEGEGRCAYSPSELLDAVESGRLDLEAPVSVLEEGEPRPLRRYLRELVWLSYQDESQEVLGEGDERNPFRVAFARTDAGMAISDLSGRLMLVNQAFARLLGGVPEDYRGVMVGDISDSSDHEREAELGNRLFRGEFSSYQIRKRFRHRSGLWVPALVNISLVRDDLGRPQMVVASSLDLRAEIEAERVRAVERESIAIQRLARGVAHDFSNLLTVIRSSADLLREEHGLGTNEDLVAIGQAASAAEHLSRQLRILSAVGTEGVSRVELVSQIRARRPLLEHLVGSGQHLMLDLPSREVWMHLDEMGLEQVLLNLVLNASQASPADGRVVIRVEDRAGRAELSVSDSGVGMAAEVQARIFEPFFSARRGGTGLGLSIVQAALTRQGLCLDVESAPGAGTRMRVRSVETPFESSESSAPDSAPADSYAG